MNKLLIVFNICGIKQERENISQYIKHLKSLLSQNNINEHKIAISGCKSSQRCKEELINTFKNSINYNWIDNIYPINVTFNHTCLKYIKQYGEFEGYLYIDSGISFPELSNIEELYTTFKENDCAMLAAQTSTDGGYLQWFGLGSHHNDISQNHTLFSNGDFKIPIGKTVNLHCQIFSNALYKAYSKLIPDIFSSYCTESTFGCLCAGINKDFILSKNVVVDHIHGMDLGSAGFDPIIWARTGRPTWNHPYIINDIVDRLIDGQKYGIFYETCQNIIPVLNEAYKDGKAIYLDELKEYCKNNLFLQHNELDYNTIC